MMSAKAEVPFCLMTKFFAPVTNLFRSSVKTVTTEGMCSSNCNSTFSGHLNKRSTNGTAQRIQEKGASESMTGEDDDLVIIEQENSVLCSLISKQDLYSDKSTAEQLGNKENEKKEISKDSEDGILVEERKKSLNVLAATPARAADKEVFRESSLLDETLRYNSPSPQPEHSISQQISPLLSRSGSGISSDKWERRRTSSSSRNMFLLSRYSPYKIFLSKNLHTNREGRFDRQANVVDKESKERYRRFLEEAGILKAGIALSCCNERKRSSKRTNYLELLQRGQSALNSVSQSNSSSASLSRRGSTTTISSNNITLVEEKNSSDSEFSEDSNCNIQETKHSGSRDEVCIVWDTKHRDDFKALWEKEKNMKLLAEHRLAMHRQQATLRDRRAKELQIQKRLIEEARRDEELSLEEQLRRKLTLTGYIFRSRKAKDEFPELDDEAVLLVERAWDRKLPLSEKLSDEITRKDLLTLKELDWLNDEVINFYMNLICKRSENDESLPKVYAFNSFFYSTLSSKGYASVKRWTRKIDIFAYELLLVPVHLGAHWCLCVIDFKNRIIDYYDSMGGSNDHCLDILSEYLCEESLDKRKKEFDLSRWQLVNRDDIPQQMNGSDCGMFACKFAEYASRRAQISFNQQHMPYFRNNLCSFFIQFFMIWMNKSEAEVLRSNIDHIKDGIVDLAAGTVGKLFLSFHSNSLCIISDDNFEGGIVNVAAGQPLDTVKVKMQTFPTFYPKGMQCFESILRTDGIRGLYAGTVPALTSNIAENAILFTAYGYCKKIVAFAVGRSELEDMTPIENALSGSLASIFAAVVICPTELVKCRLQARNEAFPGIRSNPFPICRDMYRTSGLKAFYTGMLSTLYREMIGYFLFFGAYELSRFYLTPEGKSKSEIGILRTALSGGIGGVTLWAAVYPVDVVKSRMQVAGSGSFTNIFRSIVKNEGIRTLYNGLTFTLVRAFWATGCLFVTYENSKLLFKAWLL
uniref:ULP_PROTEASE domain-containing protein n=1 Tax=Onchocerca volvulus TaxID=6282 RepID=A0A8R1Y4M6_ONCVO